jgi:hypothetical protein
MRGRRSPWLRRHERRRRPRPTIRRRTGRCRRQNPARLRRSGCRRPTRLRPRPARGSPGSRSPRRCAALDVGQLVGRRRGLTGFIFCGACGLKMHAKPRAKRGSSTRYVCTKRRIEGPQGCGSVSRNIEPVDYLMTEAIIYRLDSPPRPGSSTATTRRRPDAWPSCWNSTACGRRRWPCSTTCSVPAR